MIIRLPIFRPAIGFHTWTVIHHNVRYGKPTLLADEQINGLRAYREESENLFFRDVRYSLKDEDGRCVVFVRGYNKNDSHFYIERVETASESRDGIRNFRRFSEIVERDIRSRGITCATALAPVKMAPIMVKWFGFDIARGIPLEKLKRGWRRRIPGMLILLKKT
jgi:hypothetical protein